MEVVAEPVISFLVEKLGDQLIQEAISLIGLRDQVEWIEEELQWMRSLIKDLDFKQQGDERVKNWVRDVRVIAYDMEDVIDNFLLKIEPLRRRGCLRSVMRCAFIVSELIARHKIASKIKRIQLKIDAISKRRSTYGLENIRPGEGTSSAGGSLQEWRLTSPNVQEPDFVGFEKELEALIGRLTEGELRRCVVSVVGMGGLGKTTLTKKVYNTDSVKKHFDAHVWISVSQQYAVKDLLQVIIRRWMVLPDHAAEKIDVAELRDKISEYLNDKRYLVVFDDIWAKEAWDGLKDAFPDMNNGSRVVLTTRNKDVALHADARSQPHELRLLNNEDSWRLFCKKAFPGQDGGCPQDLEELGIKIVGKCHCLPLAIVVIGGLLSTKEAREWEKISKSISWQFSEGEVEIFGILALSYKDLPYYLKACFLYLGNFPEDYEFSTKEVIQMWVAEGLVEQRGELTLEEVGEDYLNKLIQRSMIQIAKRSSSGGIKSCRIHDLLRDISISEAKESMFLEVHHGSGNANAPSASLSKARRLASYYNYASKYISLRSSSTPHLRSVLFYTEHDAWLQREEEKFLYRGFKLLRVLYLHGVKIEELPKEIGELIHLRYLVCTNTRLKSLPSSIGNLSNLQTLLVKSSYFCTKVPSTIGKLQQLRHLQVKGRSWGEIEGQQGLEQISNLQTLSKVRAGQWMMEGCLGKLTTLRKLGIVLGTPDDAEVFTDYILKLGCLQSLSVSAGRQGRDGRSGWRTVRSLVPDSRLLECDVLEEFEISMLVPPLSHLLKLSKLYLEGNLERLPESTEFPAKLTKLTLEYSRLEQDPLTTLEKLKNLHILRLLTGSYSGKEMACSAQGFPLLESLCLLGLHNLEEWRVEEGAMPCLLHLRIEGCHALKKLPEGLQLVNKKLELWDMSSEFWNGVRGGTYTTSPYRIEVDACIGDAAWHVSDD